MKIGEFQNEQQKVLYHDGQIDASHDMFIDLDDMWRGCLRCKLTKLEDLKEPCSGADKRNSQ